MSTSHQTGSLSNGTPKPKTRDNLDRAGLDMLYPEASVSALQHADRGRVAIFIDGSNLFYAALQLGIEIDYVKLLEHLVGRDRLLRAFFYTGVDPSHDKQHNFLLWMSRNGYRVRTKEVVQCPDGSKKADMDVEIAIDMVTLVDHYDTAILVSGDGDLAYAVNAIGYRGVRAEVVSLRSMTSDSLIDLADWYEDLADLALAIQKDKNERPYLADSDSPASVHSSKIL